MENRGLQCCEHCHGYYMSHEGCDCEESKVIDAQIEDLFSISAAKSDKPSTEETVLAS